MGDCQLQDIFHRFFIIPQYCVIFIRNINRLLRDVLILQRSAEVLLLLYSCQIICTIQQSSTYHSSNYVFTPLNFEFEFTVQYFYYNMKGCVAFNLLWQFG